MIQFEEFTLNNGLRVIVHEDHTVQLAVMNILYDVGSRDEDPSKTGFAHLFEHLMFGGSANIPSYDEPLQLVGGENNAFTSTDITNYYLTVPAANLETGFWLESDRMMSLSFDPNVLEVQRKVVIEEFKQRYLNQPYGDVWLKLRPLAYEKHPYQWATIGKEISHIENATLQDVKTFFYKHYLPNNAVLVVAGNVTLDQVKKLSQKWFGPIPSGVKEKRNLLLEPPQTKKKVEEVEAKVPAHAIYKTWHMCGRFDNDYYATDFLSDILSRGHSSRLYQTLVQEREIFSSISSFVMGTVDPGLFVVSGRVREGIDLVEAEKEIDQVLQQVVAESVTTAELEKVKNQAEASLQFGEVEVLNRAMNLAFASLSGDPGLVNREAQLMERISAADLQRVASSILREENASVLYYHSIK
ncbi:MAG: insulinase family protein [Cytophagales bacterium]|jgi:zinc protease|nr:insulinase family protein [Cytophagales bacterium]MCA6386926.1 insulinase family protein [Cytophagales bacterium]MCA6390229.1 insulinase family protein [Cytophagales bacterium]MCA6395247.1 insulinase family protein [Cytophagales bacterium]MCA6398455.1 insulinase family protein [Cytophagales bacterium]